MKHSLVLAMLLIGTSLTWAHSSSPIKLSAVRQNTGKIVRSVNPDRPISAYLEEKNIEIDFWLISNEILISIYDQNGILIYEEVVNSNESHISIDISNFDKNDYTIPILIKTIIQ
ncbi:DUF3244 domain-containing protein [Parabacteroides sp. AF48-14]|uniref:DUF3244 domain-containing protein n=1 Tax=Parabacteroides sp. AF48-14 TaxID=2292052 RepID=UPI000EFE393E|nr:DUF3244 domain-containing protein [Parabacteroides sp. AF48-14]RHO67807.1 DUF3244 domain-containing protein [Parabacteroides sp. AF48-14]